MISERGLEVLRVIVQDYVASSEPVGSKSIVERHQFDVSAATIRGDMAQLEDAELIVAPHTSSGRVPTDKGYRVFVDRLQGMQPLSAAQRQAISRFLGESVDLDDVMTRTVRLLSQLTNQVAIVQYPSVAKARVRRIEAVAVAPTRALLVAILDSGRVEQRVIDFGAVIDAEAVQALGTTLSEAAAERLTGDAAVALQAVADRATSHNRQLVERATTALREMLEPASGDRLLMAGTSHLVRTGRDFQGTVLPVLEAIEEQVTLLTLFREMDVDASGVATSIGRENVHGLEETSIVAGAYAAQGHEVARVGVLGPTRMDYASNMAAVRAVARYLTKLLDEDQ